VLALVELAFVVLVVRPEVVDVRLVLDDDAAVVVGMAVVELPVAVESESFSVAAFLSLWVSGTLSLDAHPARLVRTATALPTAMTAKETFIID